MYTLLSIHELCYTALRRGAKYGAFLFLRGMCGSSNGRCSVLANVTTIRKDNITWGTNCVPEHLKG